MEKFDILEAQIRLLELRIRDIGLLNNILTEQRTNGCTNGCTGACPDPTGNCTYSCTNGCTNGCTDGCTEMTVSDFEALVIASSKIEVNLEIPNDETDISSKPPKAKIVPKKKV